MNALQRAIFQLFLVLFLAIVTPIAIFWALVGLAQEMFVFQPADSDALCTTNSSAEIT